MSIFNKIYETVLHKWFTDYLNLNSIIARNQYWFRKKSNTTLAILNFTSDILRTFRNKRYCIALFLDFRKAFDCMNSCVLLSKLNSYGFRGVCNSLINSYLANWNQFVVINGSVSTIQPVIVLVCRRDLSWDHYCSTLLLMLL